MSAYRVATIDYDPLPVFHPFHQTELREAAIIGGYGSGKSVALCADALKQALRQPGSEWIIARQTVNSLRDTTEKTFFDLLPGEFLAQCDTARGGGHYQYIKLPNGSLIHFKSLDDWKKWKSMNIAGFFLDEADEISQESYEGLITRVRQVHPLKGAVNPNKYIRSGYIRIAMNPNGHDYYWARFIKSAERQDARTYFTRDDDPNKRRMAFLSTSLDNPYNPSSYLEHLLSFPEPWVKRYVFCSFDDFQGVIYPEWDWPTHVIDPYFQYSGPVFLMGMDPGTQNPTAAMWCYYDQAKNCLVGIAEYLQAGVAVSPHVSAWRRIERNGTHNMSRHPGAMNVGRRVADPSIATRDRGSMMSLESQYASKGFHFDHGPKVINDRLPALGELIHANRFKVTKELELAYEQIKNYRYEDLTPQQIEKGVEAKPFKRNVDIVDAAQYIASRHTRGQGPQRPVRVERPREQIQNEHDFELKMRVKQLREDGLHLEADNLEAELIPELSTAEDFRRQRKERELRRTLPLEKTAGLA